MVIVYVDEREKNSKVPQLLASRGVTVIYKVLEVGDYIASDRVGIERKSSFDFIKSIVDGRLFDQAKRLVEAFEKPIVIVEGSLREAMKYFRVKRSSVLGAYVSLGLDYGIIVVNTRDEEETAEIIKRIALREQEKRSGIRSVPSAKKPKLRTVEEWQLYILQCFPHIGPKIAQRILEVFGSIHRFCNASLSELARIEGLSEKKASEIIQILRAQHRSYLAKQKQEAKTIIDYMKKGDGSSS